MTLRSQKPLRDPGRAPEYPLGHGRVMLIRQGRRGEVRAEMTREDTCLDSDSSTSIFLCSGSRARFAVAGRPGEMEKAKEMRNDVRRP